MLHSLCVSEPFAALPPLRIAELYIAFAMPINAHLCPCLSKQSARYYAVANPCFTSPLPRDLCFTLPLPRQSRPRRAAHSPRVAYPSLSIAKHSIPCRREARLFFAFARHIKSLQCRCHELHTKAFAYPALPDQAFASLRSSKSCPRYTQQSKPLPNIAINAAAIRARHGATPPLRLMASHGVSLRCPAIPLLGWAFHSNSPRRPCRQSQSQPCCAIALLCRSRPLPAPPSHLIEHFVGEPSLSGIPPLADASEPSVVQPLHNSGKMCLLV